MRFDEEHNERGIEWQLSQESSSHTLIQHEVFMGFSLWMFGSFA
jgi:hypothetical protein